MIYYFWTYGLWYRLIQAYHFRYKKNDLEGTSSYETIRKFISTTNENDHTCVGFDTSLNKYFKNINSFVSVGNFSTLI